MTTETKSEETLPSELCASAAEALATISNKLSSADCCELPTWWISKLSAAVAYLDILKDHISDSVEEAVEEQEEEAMETEDDMLPPSARMMKRLSKQ